MIKTLVKKLLIKGYKNLFIKEQNQIRERIDKNSDYNLLGWSFNYNNFNWYDF